MDLDEFRVMLSKSKMDVWALIETAITLASLDYGKELRDRRDKIVEKLYLASSAPVYRNCENDGGENRQEHDQHHPRKRSTSPLTTPESNQRNYDEHENNEEEEEDELDPYGGLFDDDQTRILELKERLEDLNQSEDSLIELLQTLADMDITFPVLQSSDIGRYVNKYRRHSSSKVRDLVKLLVSKWKETVDEWVKLNPDANLSANEDSPQQNVQQKVQRNGHHQGSDSSYSPNPNVGSSSERNYSEPERKPKPVPPREAPPRAPQSAPKSVSVPPPSRPKEPTIDLEKLNSARKRLHENYQEAQNAKKQRTIQVMDIHEIPKPKNAFFAKNKGGFQGRHHR